jgi:hypothetical protein
MFLVPELVEARLQVPAVTLAAQLTNPSLTVTVPVGVPDPGATL